MSKAPISLLIISNRLLLTVSSMSLATIRANNSTIKSVIKNAAKGKNGDSTKKVSRIKSAVVGVNFMAARDANKTETTDKTTRISPNEKPK